MPNSIRYTERFKRAMQSSVSRKKEAFVRKLRLFVQNPFYSSLIAKKIEGSETLFERSVNMDLRVIWLYEGDKLIILLDIGHHSVLKCY